MTKRTFFFAAALTVQSLLLSCSCSRSRVQTDAAVDVPVDVPVNAQEAAKSPSTQTDAPTGKPFGALCTKDEECAQGVCFHKRIKGADSGPERRDVRPDAEEREGYCSLHCNGDADCPTPPTRGKCGARGMCKRAD